MIQDDFFKRIDIQYNHNLPFVVYRKPNEIKVSGMLQSTDDLIFTKDFTEKGFVFSPFDDAEKTVLMPIEASEVITTTEQPVIPDGAKVQSIQDNTLADSKSIHIKLVNKGVEAINKGVFKKVVLSRKETVELEENNPISIFKRLLNKYASAFVYCWYHPKVGLWLGATPETLVKIEGTRFSIMALAGTQDYKGSLNVVWQDKEKQEQKFVTDFIVDSLQDTVEHLQISKTETVKAGNLLHLKTMISARLKPNSALKDVITNIHPTPAVCGLPKQEAKVFIVKNEDYKREFYTGFLGELNLDIVKAPRSGKRNIENRAYAITKKSTQLYVNLRCMQIQDNKAIIYIGGGVTINSHADSEWEETVSKSQVIKSIL
ncbi:chorismate-binding protein [Thalassobellus suaedae]|uniref:Chorismate-binding protein n=1 Tax=Thalassobellus suaedae TaxID=3074124 RepID=A0ABY9XX60_9FLAO|nr:chorismate-binding protein [Flavobacteriaceae bacterium HL-DH14]